MSALLDSLLRRQPSDDRPPRSPALPRLARLLLLATFCGSLGTGLVLPFLVVYLSQVRGMSTAIGGLVLVADFEAAERRAHCLLVVHVPALRFR